MIVSISPERHGVSHDAKDADDHEQQANPGERAELGTPKSRLGVGELFEIAFEQAGVRERDVAIDGPDFLANAIEGRAGIDGGDDAGSFKVEAIWCFRDLIEDFQRRGGEKSVRERKVDSTFSTSLPLASDLSRAACHSGSLRKASQLALAASRLGCARM